MALKGQRPTQYARPAQPVQAQPVQAAPVQTQQPRTLTGDDVYSLLSQVVSSGQYSITEQSFSTGSLGLRFTGKGQSNGDRYQISVQMVRIGTKPQQ
jgi:hypothetical protein